MEKIQDSILKVHRFYRWADDPAWGLESLLKCRTIVESAFNFKWTGRIQVGLWLCSVNILSGSFGRMINFSGRSTLIER